MKSFRQNIPRFISGFILMFLVYGALLFLFSDSGFDLFQVMFTAFLFALVMPYIEDWIKSHGSKASF